MLRHRWGFILWPLSIVFLPRDTFAFWTTLKADRLRHARTRADLGWLQCLPYLLLPGGSLPSLEVDP